MIDLDELERLHREGLRYPEGVEYDVARTEAFDALPKLLRLARRARRLEEEARKLLAADEAYDPAGVVVTIAALAAALAEGEK